MTRVIISGAAGRMGATLLRCAKELPNIRIVGAIEQSGHESVGKDAGAIAGIGDCGVRIVDDLKKVPQGDVLVDFALHSALPDHARWAVEKGVAMVIGTTGLSGEETAAVEKAGDRIPIVWAPNMSLGVNLLFALVKRAAEILGRGYKVEINETHHTKKKDAPSGTALRLGEKAAEGRKQDFREVLIHEPGTKGHKHEAHKIVIHSHREGEVIGDHEVVFESQGERVSLAHHAAGREAFAMGALRAAEWVVTRRPRVYDMQDVLGLRS